MIDLIINIKASPGSSKSEIVKIDEENYRVKLKNPPVKGRANKELIDRCARITAHYSDKNKKKVAIKIRQNNEQKTVEAEPIESSIIENLRIK